MKIVACGMSGFIGRPLARELSKKYELALLTRAQSAPPSGPVRTVRWDPSAPGEWEKEIDGAYAIVNLSGASIAGGRWTKARKKMLIESRLRTTRALVDAIGKAAQPPKVFLSASAVGFYGSRGEEPLDESSTPGTGFLPDLCREWERQARKAEAHGVRVVLLRTGIVLSPEGGALSKMLPPFRMFVGGPLGSGRQYMSWIHLEDEVRAVLHALENEVRGPLNLTAPQPVTMREFAKTLGKVLHRPSSLPAPSPAIRLLLGEMSELLLEGQNVRPARLTASGFSFRHPALEPALKALLAS